MLKFVFLGGFSASLDGKEVTGLSGIRSQWLLARLLLDKQSSISRSELASAMWPESTPEQARTNLRRELHKLRAAHHEIASAIRLEGQYVRWEMPAGGALDIDELAGAITQIAAVEADDCPALVESILQLDRGALLPILSDDWVNNERAAMTRTLCDALRTLAARLEKLGQYRLVTRLAERLLRHDRLNEAAYHLLMVSQIGLGDRSRAIHTYHTCRAALRDELEIEPGHLIQEMFVSICDMTDNQAPGRPPSLRRSVHASTGTVALVGRQPVLQQLVQIWERVGSSGAHLACIEGEAGIGKTRLADELMNIAESTGTITARTRAYAAEGVLPFSCIRYWLTAPGIAGELPRVSDIAQAELAQTFPGIFDKESAGQLKPIEPGKLGRQRLFHALAEPFRSLPKPALLLIDDLQWCDEDTMQWLNFLVRELADSPILILATMRQDELSEKHPATALIKTLLLSDQLDRINLERLEPAAVATLVQRIHEDESKQHLEGARPAPNAAAIYQLCGGNPFFTIEYVKAGIAQGQPGSDPASVPEPVDRVISERMAAMSGAANKVACLASVVGREFSESVIERVGSLCTDEIVEAIDELWRCQIISDDGNGQYIFVHDCLRESIYASMGPALRRLHHRQIAAALLASHNRQGISGELAYHCQQGGELEQAAHWFHHAARAAYSRLAFKEAIRFAQLGRAALKALEDVQDSVDFPEENLQLILAEAVSVQALGDGATDHLRRLRDSVENLLPSVLDSEVRFAAVERLRHLYAQTDVEKALELSEELIRIANAGLRVEFTVSARRSHGFTQFQLGRFLDSICTLSAASEQIEDGFESGKLQKTRPVHHIHIVLGQLAYMLEITGNVGKANDVLARLYQLPVEHLPIIGQGYVRHFLVQNAMLRRDRTVVSKHLAWMKRINEQNDVGIPKLLEAEFSAWLAFDAEHLHDAIQAQQQAIKISEIGLHGMYHPKRYAILAQMYLSASDNLAALQSVENGLKYADRSVQPFWNAELYRLRALGLAELGSPANSIQQAFDRSLHISIAQGARLLTLRCQLSQARYLIRIDRIQEAQKLLAQLAGDYRACSGLFEHSEIAILQNGINRSSN